MKLGLLIILLGLCGPSAATHVTDRLVIGLYEAPALKGEPQRLLAGGTPIEVLARSAGKARVRLGDGTTGWIEARYISEEKSAAMQLLEARIEIRRLHQRLADVTSVEGKTKDAPLPSVAVRTGIEFDRARERIAELKRSLDKLAKRLQQIYDLPGVKAPERRVAFPVSYDGAGYLWGLSGFLVLAGFVAGVALVKLRLRRRYGDLRL